MKITRKNIGMGLRAVISDGWRPSFAKALAAHTFGYAATEHLRRHSPIVSLPLSDPRIGCGTSFTLSYEAKKGNTSLLEEYVLLSLVRSRAVQSFFEFGTYLGQTSYLLAKNFPSLRIHTLDLPASDVDHTSIPISAGERRYVEKPVVGATFLDTPEQSRITQLTGDSAAFDYSPFEHSMDCVFVDGCHDYDYVKNDTLHARRLIKEKGMILWHDYLTYESVSRFLNELGQDLPLFHIPGTSFVLFLRG